MTDPEFSRLIQLDTLGEEPRTVDLVADEAERAALARRFGWLSLERLEARVAIRRSDAIILAEGRLDGAVTQACVVTDTPLPRTVTDNFSLRFVPEEMLAAGEEIELDEGALDVVGYDGGQIDLGETVAEGLALALDPFPRAPDAAEALREAGVLAEGEAGPFGALKALKDRLG